MSKIGILFDISKIESTFYGYEAFKIFFNEVNPDRLKDCALFDGDTSETLAGSENIYCIAVQTGDKTLIEYIKNKFECSPLKELAPANRRLIYDNNVDGHPLVESCVFDTSGNIIICKTGWINNAMEESRKARKETGETASYEIPVIPAPATTAAPYQLQGVGGWLLLFIIGTFLSAILNFLMAAQSGSSSVFAGGNILITYPPANIIIGLVGLISAIMLSVSRNAYAVWMARIYMILYLIMNIVIAIKGLDAPAGYYVINEEGEIIKGILSGVFVNIVWQTYFSVSKRVKATYYRTQKESGMFSPEGKSLTSLLNRKEYGINYLIGVSYAVAIAALWFVYPLYMALEYGEAPRFALSYFLIVRVPILLIYALMLTAIANFIKNDWLIAAAMGLVSLLVYLLSVVIFGGREYDGVRLIDTITIPVIVNVFLWSPLIFSGIILSIKLWRASWWGFIIGAVTGSLISEVINQLVYGLGNGNVSVDIKYIFYSIGDGIILGLCLYLGIALHLKLRGVKLSYS